MTDKKAITKSLLQYCINKAFSRRAILHWPHGALTAALATGGFLLGVRLDLGSIDLCCLAHVGLVLATLWTWTFVYYENNEDTHEKDGAHKDMFGYLTGFVLYLAILLALVV